jgi:diketogulonate reductase-like aldo/keto reductase
VVVALSRGTEIDRIGNNAAIFDFELSSEEMATIGALTRPDQPFRSCTGLAACREQQA